MEHLNDTNGLAGWRRDAASPNGLAVFEPDGVHAVIIEAESGCTRVHPYIVDFRRFSSVIAGRTL